MLYINLTWRISFYYILVPKATAEANNLAAVATAKDQYYKNMERVGQSLEKWRVEWIMIAIAQFFVTL